MVGNMNSAMEAALKTPAPVLVGLVEINLPDHDLRLLDGASELVWAGNQFVGMDPVYGSLAETDALGDGLGDQAPALAITLLPTSAADAAELTRPDVQGSRVRIWFAVVDTSTGSVVPDPYLLFDGRLDQATLAMGKGSLTLEYECVSGLEPLFLQDEGIRLSAAHHKDVWPGETGLDQVTGLVRTIIWGPGDRPPGIATAPAPASTPGGAYWWRGR